MVDYVCAGGCTRALPISQLYYCVSCPRLACQVLFSIAIFLCNHLETIRPNSLVHLLFLSSIVLVKRLIHIIARIVSRISPAQKPQRFRIDVKSVLVAPSASLLSHQRATLLEICFIFHVVRSTKKIWILIPC